MIRIRDKKRLIENGEAPLLQKARGLALTSLEAALGAAEPKSLIHSKLILKGTLLRVGRCSFDLAKYKHVYVVGGGKAGAAMALATEEILGKRIVAGVVNIPYFTKRNTRVIELNEAGHPVPNEAGVEGTQRMVELAQKATADDLLICLISGGGSSLMPLPREGVTLEDKQQLTDTLLKSGTPIGEINVVRKHLSAFKGGWLAKKAYPARVLNLVLSDVIGDPLDSIASGPTVADPSTFSDALQILEKRCLLANAPPSVRKVLSDGKVGLIEETPKPGDMTLRNVCSVVVGNNNTARLAAVEHLKRQGLNTLLVRKPLQGEAQVAGAKLAALARRIDTSRRAVKKPAGVVAGGETTVQVFGKGIGGRNQELVLSAALSIRSLSSCVIASLCTDGVDGPTDAAGAFADIDTLQKGKRLGLNAPAFLADNDSYSFFSRIGDLLQTGPTGTNVNDITVIVIL